MVLCKCGGWIGKNNDAICLLLISSLSYKSGFPLFDPGTCVHGGVEIRTVFGFGE